MSLGSQRNGLIGSMVQNVGTVVSAVAGFASQTLFTTTKKPFSDLHSQAVRERRAMEVKTADGVFDAHTASRTEIQAVIRRLERELSNAECQTSLKVMDAQTKLTAAQAELKKVRTELASVNQYVTSLEQSVEEYQTQLEALKVQLEDETEQLRQQASVAEQELLSCREVFTARIAELNAAVATLEASTKVRFIECYTGARHVTPLFGCYS
jgi:chromosome segregation ATPase